MPKGMTKTVLTRLAAVLTVTSGITYFIKHGHAVRD